MELRILFLSRSFYPAVGGQESVARSLARGFAGIGVPVKLITYTALNGCDELKETYQIIRRPETRTFLIAVAWCTLFFHHSLSLRSAWPLLFFKRKWVILHHILYQYQLSYQAPCSLAKRFLLRFPENIYPSEYVRSILKKRGHVVYNPVDDEVFFKRTGIVRSRALLFAGRLVSDKGCDIAINAVKLLNDRMILPAHLTVVGDGPEKTRLQTLANNYGLSEKIVFTGTLPALQLSEMMNRHRIIIVSSIFNEPFGMVAVEALACGCFPVASNTGGLPEACLGMGLTFEPGNAMDLADKLAELLEVIPADTITGRPSNFRKKHLTKFVVNRYLDLFTARYRRK